MNRLNDIAILLTQKIESELVYEFITNKSQPEFRKIRETILDTLREYLNIYFIESKESPNEMRNIPEKTRIDYMNHKLEKEAGLLARDILQDKEVINKFEWSDKDDWYKSTTKMIAIVKLQKIIDETDSDYFKDRW